MLHKDISTNKLIDRLEGRREELQEDGLFADLSDLLLQVAKKTFRDSNNFNHQEIPTHFESVVEFCKKNNFGRSTITKFIQEHKLQEKDFFRVTDPKNKPVYYIDPIPFLQTLQKKNESTKIKKNAERSLELYLREKKVTEKNWL